MRGGAKCSAEMLLLGCKVLEDVALRGNIGIGNSMTAGSDKNVIAGSGKRVVIIM
jgi:hypothetical protein